MDVDLGKESLLSLQLLSKEISKSNKGRCALLPSRRKTNSRMARFYSVLIVRLDRVHNEHWACIGIGTTPYVP